MTEQRPAVRRTWRARLPVEFGHFVLFDVSGHSSAAGLGTTDSRWIAVSGAGGAMFHATDRNLEADVVVNLHDTDPGPDNAEDHSYTGGFRTDSGNLLLAASTGSPADITVDLPAPGDYRLSARRLPDLVDTSLGDQARCEQWILRI
ncbi:hypothetical protein ADK67_25470 [Saccharothrix sp. NRRL B-16348]|nr:hypothetical protein ADK67_25470 [Saccharothrix sp. NRRL B-16348]